MAVNLVNSTSSDPTVYGTVDVTYLTGEGRALSNLYLEITRQTLGTAADDIGIVDLGPFRLSLDDNANGTLQLPRINVPFGATTGGRANARLFSTLPFEPNRLVTSQVVSGTVTYAQGPALNGLPFTADSRIRVFPGRTSTLQVVVTPSEFPLDGSTTGDDTDRTFDQAQFKGFNYSMDTTDTEGVNKLSSRLSDFVRFSLAGMDSSLRPALRFGYGTGDVTPNGASYVYFSGDNIALSNNVSGATSSIFQEVASEFSDDPTSPIGNTRIGLWSNSSGEFSGTYDLRDILPTTIETDVPMNRLVSLYGGFRDFNDVLLGGTTCEMILFPNSADSFSSTTTGRDADIVAVVRTGGQITNMYFGGANLSETSATKGRFRLFPIRLLGTNPAGFDTTLELDGDLTNYRNSSNAPTTDYPSARKLNFTFDAGTSLPDNFTQTGTVTVFRI